MGTFGIYLLLFAAALAFPGLNVDSNKNRREVTKGDHHCKNTTLLISLEKKGTIFRLVSNANNSLLNTNYSTTASRGIQKLIQFMFLYFFPEYRTYILPLRNYSSEINVLRKTDGNREVIEVYYGGEIILQSSEISELVGKVKTKGEEVVCGRLGKIKVIAEEGIDVNKADAYSFRPLHWAALLGDLDLGRRLVAGGAEVNAGGAMGLTALHWAAASGQTDMVRCLLASGAQPDIGAQEAGTPLQAAAEMGRLDVVKVLAGNGADVNLAQVKDGRTPFLKAASSGHLDTLKELIKLGADSKARDGSGFSALHIAALRGDLKMSEYLLSLGLDVNSKDLQGRTPLMLAVDRKTGYGDNLNVVELLIRSGADTNARDSLGQTPLSIGRHFDAVTSLLKEHGARGS